MGESKTESLNNSKAKNESTLLNEMNSVITDYNKITVREDNLRKLIESTISKSIKSLTHCVFNLNSKRKSESMNKQNISECTLTQLLTQNFLTDHKIYILGIIDPYNVRSVFQQLTQNNLKNKDLQERRLFNEAEVITPKFNNPEIKFNKKKLFTDEKKMKALINTLEFTHKFKNNVGMYLYHNNKKDEQPSETELEILTTSFLKELKNEAYSQSAIKTQISTSNLQQKEEEEKEISVFDKLGQSEKKNPDEFKDEMGNLFKFLDDTRNSILRIAPAMQKQSTNKTEVQAFTDITLSRIHDEKSLISKNTLEIQKDPKAEAEAITEREEKITEKSVINEKYSSFRTEKAQSFFEYSQKREKRMISPKRAQSQGKHYSQKVSQNCKEIENNIESGSGYKAIISIIKNNISLNKSSHSRVTSGARFICRFYIC